MDVCFCTINEGNSSSKIWVPTHSLVSRNDHSFCHSPDITKVKGVLKISNVLGTMKIRKPAVAPILFWVGIGFKPV